jgi:hypothetical protein
MFNRKKKIKESLPENPKSSPAYNDVLFSDSSDDIKEKHRSLINGLLNVRDKKNLDIRIENDSIWIIYDKYTNGPQVSISHNDGSISISVLKNIGCVISMGTRSTRFKDEDLYTQILNNAKISRKEVDIQIFEDLYSSAISKFEISRGINIEKILN